MKLRDLELKDAPLMLEWMHDQSVVANLRGNFLGKTIKDAEEFIKLSRNKLQNIHLAIATDEDEYMGTVSLKNVDRDNNSGICYYGQKVSNGKRLFVVWYGRDYSQGI